MTDTPEIWKEAVADEKLLLSLCINWDLIGRLCFFKNSEDQPPLLSETFKFVQYDTAFDEDAFLVL